MGVSNIFPLPNNVMYSISSYVDRPWSVAGSCGAGTDIAEMDDVSEEIIAILTREFTTYDSELIDVRIELGYITQD